MLVSSVLMDVLGLRHGDTATIDNIFQEKPYNPIECIHITLANCPNSISLPLLQLSKLEKEYCLSDLLQMYFRSTFLTPSTYLILPVVDSYLQGHIDSIEPSTGGILSPSSNIIFHTSSDKTNQSFYHAPKGAVRYLKAIQSSIGQIPLECNAIQVKGIAILGGVGSGKTSLLKYFTNEINKMDENRAQPKSALFVSSSSFPYSDPFSVIDSTPSLRVLCIDDVDDLSEGWENDDDDDDDK